MAWQSETLFHNSDEFFSHLISDIDKAKTSIKFECYIFKFDELGIRILEALARAAERKVFVEIMVDGVGSMLWEKQLLVRCQDQKLKIIVYHPLPALFRPSTFFKRLWRLNRRNHRKVCVIDSKIAYVGSQNVDIVHLKEFSKEEAWRDTGVKVEGDSVKLLERAFGSAADRKWFKLDANFENYDWEQSASVKLNDSYYKRRKYYHEVKSRIATAKKRIWITNPYFNPPRFFIKTLCAAARAGADVRILLGHKIDHIFLRWLNTYYYPLLLKSGVRLFEYHGPILHAKSRMIDDWITVGSSNKNYRSFFNDLEVDVVLNYPESKMNLENQFAIDLNHSQELNLEEWKKRSFIHRMVERFFYLFREWM